MDAPQALRVNSTGPMQATSGAIPVTMGAPLNTSLIQNSEDITISGGQFTSAAGDVTVHHHHYPYLELGSTRISPLLNIVDDTFSENEIYSNQLLRQKRGFPLYVPGPQQTLPEEYRKRGIAIGDVGRITPEGSFDFFFNIYLPADHPIHNHNVPEDFSPLPLYDTLDLYDQSYLEGHHVSTPSTQRLDTDPDIFPGGDFVFRCHDPQGAVLALPHGSHLQKLRNLEPIREYAARHAESWFQYVNGPRGRGLDGSLYLVTGSEKALSWGMASFHSVRDAFQLTFTLPARASGYRWRGNPAQKKYHDPSPMHEPYRNQTTFIHGLSISLGTGVWARMFETVQIREIANTESRLGGGGGNSTLSSQGSSLFLRVLGLFGGGAARGNDEQSRRHVVSSDFPAISQMIHPGELINNYILAKAPQATVVMSHDDDWCDIFGEGNPAQTMSDLLQRIGDEHVIVEKGGATFLQAMSASSRNESPELFGRSGSRSRITTHTSLPALDDPFNPLHHHPAHDMHDISSMRSEREREGSVATPRRPSRSLDDQVSVLTLGDNTNNNNAHAPNAPSMTISVPENDDDWHSLSARASAQRESSTSINTPPVFTMPKFAPPVSAVNSSPHSNNRGNVNSSGGGASFDGFGFDHNWSAIRSGITELDMNSVVVHSSSGPVSASSPSHGRASRDRRRSQLSLMPRSLSTARGGSMMNDPDTFLAAVRGWGGDEYEQQRKYWTFRKDLADGRGGEPARCAAPPSGTSSTRGAALNPLRSITGRRAGMGKGLERKDLTKGGRSGSGSERQGLIVPWRGMSLNAEEIWNSSLVGSFTVLRIELGAQKPQQRVIIDPFQGGPKPPHDGLYTNIHKHSKVMAFSIHRHYKPPPGVDARWSFSMIGKHLSTAKGRISGNGQRGSVNTASGRTGYATATAERRLTAMILLAPRHLQVTYTSTNATKGWRTYGLLEEGPDRDRERDNKDTRSTQSEKGRKKEKGRKEKGRKKEKGRQNGGKDKENGGKDKEKATSSKQQRGSTASSTIIAPPLPPPSIPSTYNYPPPTSTPFDGRDAGFIGPTLAARSASSSRRRRDSLNSDSDADSDSERLSSRTTHSEAFSTMDASSIDQVLTQDARYGEGSNGVLSRLVRRAPAHLTGPGGPSATHHAYIPPWMTLQSRVKQEERRRRHDVLSNLFEDSELLPPKGMVGGSSTRTKNVPDGGADIFWQVPSDALFMLLPLWPGPTDPVSERNATKQPHEIPTEQRQYLLVSYPSADDAPPSKKHDKEDRQRRRKGCDILLTSCHISARVVSHADLQGSGVRVPDEGLAVLGPWHEAWLTMPQIATRDRGVLVIGRCASQDSGIEFDPESLVMMGLCIPVPPVAGVDGLGLQEGPVAELTPIGKAVLEMAWVGYIAVTSFGPTGTS